MANEITLTLYNNSSAPNVIDKKITQVGTTLTGQLKENIKLRNVVITIPYISGYASINYAYIPEFHRYYYVEVETMNGGRLKLTMRSDVLKSFWNNYKTSPCIARRSTSSVNPDIKDDVLAFKSQPKIIHSSTPSVKFTPTSSGGCYILTVGGK